MKRWLGLALVVGVLGHVAVALLEAGTWRQAPSPSLASCREFPVTGAEDMAYLPDQDVYIVASDERREPLDPKNPSGNLWLWRPSQPLEDIFDFDFEFHPHGLAVHRLSPDHYRLWVVNHQSSGDTVEVFQWNGDQLSHEKTLRDPLLINGNDIVAVGENEFYLSHDHGSRSFLLNRAADYLRWGGGYLTYFDGSSLRVVDQGIRFANGLEISPDRQFILLAAMFEREIRIYQRLDGGDLRLYKSISTDSCPDNLSWSDSGDLLVATHLNALRLKAHAEDHDQPAPSLILRIENPLSDKPKVSPLFFDEGGRLRAASYAHQKGQRLILGAIYDRKVLQCDLGNHRQ